MIPAPQNIPVPHPSGKNFIDRTGQKFNRLTVIAYAGKIYVTRTAWRCRCDCGNEIVVESGNLTLGKQKSCGCLDREVLIERNTKHGMAKKTPEYAAWEDMRNRCTNPNNRNYQHYGARGIRYSERWNDHLFFVADVGLRPSPKHSLDRINNDGNYEPGNVRWATKVEQANNKRNNIIVEVGGVRKTLPDWCRDLSLNYGTVTKRLKMGFSPEEAFEMIPCSRIQKSAKIE